MTERDDRYDAARSMLEKLGRFASDLDEHERAALHAMLIPGVARAFREDEVRGHVATSWSPAALPEWLASAMSDLAIRLEGLD